MNDYDPHIEAFDETESSGFGWRDYLRWFVRRFWIFLITVLGGYILGLYVFSLTPETYQSHATIEIERVKKEDADVDEEERIRMTGAAEMLSVTEKLGLANLYEDAAASHLFEGKENVVPEKFLLPWQDSVERSASDLSPADFGGMMRGWINVRWRPDTTLIDLFAVHSDPEIARSSLVGLLSAYDSAVEKKVAGSSDFALDYILESSTEIKEKILDLEKAIRLYNRCIELSQEIRKAENSVSEMEKRYLPKWPALVEAKELRTILKKRFSEELQQVLRLSEDEKQFWDGNSTLLGGMEGDQLTNSQIQLVSTRSSVLERELEAEQQVYDNLLTKLKEGNVSKGFASKQFEIVQQPSLPSRPIAPKKNKILATFVMGGAALGVGIILLLGFLDPTVRTVEDLERVSTLPVIGALPTLKNTQGREKALALSEDPNSQSAEAIRSLRAGLTFLGDSDERCTFLVTSAVPGEGKSWIAANLALSFASQGDRTLLIDADLRRPVQSETFGYEKSSKGLTDHLSLGTPLKESITRSKLSDHLYLMPAGSKSANPSELLAGKNLPGMFENLADYFDRIIIDSAPLVPVADTLPLARIAQSVVLVCRMGKTPAGAIKRAIRTLYSNGSTPVGVVANGLPRTRSRGGYGYYYSYQGGGSYSNYDYASTD